MFDNTTAPFTGRLAQDFSFVVDRGAADVLALRPNDLVVFDVDHRGARVSWVCRVRRNGLSRSLRARPSAHVRALMSLKVGDLLSGTVRAITRRRR